MGYFKCEGDGVYIGYTTDLETRKNGTRCAPICIVARSKGTHCALIMGFGGESKFKFAPVS